MSESIDCLQSPIFSWDRLDIPCLTVTAFLIFKCPKVVGVGDYSSNQFRHSCKMAACNAKCSISMILQKNRGLWTVYAKYSIISTRQKIANSAKQSLDLSVDGMQLTKVESERVLGVYIDSHLTWNEHIDTLRRKLLQRIAILARARKYIPTKYRLLLYNASIKPLFTYCCTVWSNCSQTNLDELFKLQKRCARLILDSPRNAQSYDNFQYFL